MKASWIAVDWGTSNLRIWPIDETDTVLDVMRSDQGMGSLCSSEYEEVLLSHIDKWLGKEVMPVVACGMVGARQGWHEAPYDCVPTVPATKSIKVHTDDPRIDMRILSGIQQNEPADVIRGEETQISGLLQEEPDFEGVVCLPGTHSKWVLVKSGQIVRFQTAFSGEMFSLLSQQSVLRHSMGTWSDEVFITNLLEVIADPQSALSRLFSIRAQEILHGFEHGSAVLSAILIGAEIAGFRNIWEGQRVTIIGSGQLTRLYKLAFSSLEHPADAYFAGKLTLNGLLFAYKEIFR